MTFRKLKMHTAVGVLASQAALFTGAMAISATASAQDFTCTTVPYAETLDRRLRALDVAVARDLEEPRELLSPTPPEDNPNAPLPDPNPAAAIAEMDDEIRIDRLASHEAAEVYNLYAYAYYLLEDNGRAIINYERVLEEEGANGSLIVRTLKTLAQLHMIEEQFPRALDRYVNWACLRQLQGSNVGPEEYAQIATIYYRMDDHDNALEFVNRAIEMTETAGNIGKENWYAMKRSILYLKNDIPATIDVIKKLIVYYPNVKYWRELGGMFAEMEDTQRQLSSYHLAYLQNGLETEGQIKGLGYLYIAAEAPYLGAEIMVEGIENGMIEEDEEIYRAIGSAYYQAREMEKALPWMERAAEASEDGEAYGRLANIYLSLGRYDEAIRAGGEAITRGGLNRRDQVLMTVGSAYHGLKEYDRAIEEFRKIRDDRSTDAARQWITFVESEKERDRQLRASGIDLDNL